MGGGTGIRKRLYEHKRRYLITVPRIEAPCCTGLVFGGWMLTARSFRAQELRERKVDVLGSPSRIVLMFSVDVKQH